MAGVCWTTSKVLRVKWSLEKEEMTPPPEQMIENYPWMYLAVNAMAAMLVWLLVAVTA